MQYHIETLVKHLFDKDSFEQVTVQELKQFTEAYPYAAVGQYLYAKKLYDARSWNYYEQTEQASLYFHNPLWYRWLMDQKYEALVVQQRQEEPAQQNAYRVVVQMPKGVSSATAMPQETIQEPVQETVAEENHTASVASIETVKLTDITQEPFSAVGLPPEREEVQTEEPVTNLQEYQPEINTQEPIQADTEAFGFVQADGTPPEEYTETVTENTIEQQQPVQEGSAAETSVYTEEHELNLHEFQPTTDTEPIQADAESFGDIQEKDTSEEYTETVTDNTEGSQSGIETIADIPAAKEEAEITPEFFAEAAAEQSATASEQEEATMPNAVAIAESSILTEEHHITGGGELSETLEAPAEATETPVATETAELAAAAETAEAPVANEPEQVQETHEVIEHVAEYRHQEDEVQPGGDLPPYQLLDTTTEIPAAEAEAIVEKPAHESINSEPAHEGPVTIEFVHEEPVAEPAPAEPVQEQITEPAVHEPEPVNHEPVQEEAATEHTEPDQHEQQVVEEQEPVTTEMAAQEEPVAELIAPEAEPWVQEWDTEPVRNEHIEQESVVQEQEPEHVNHEPVLEEPVAEPIAQEPVSQEQEPEHVNHEPVQDEPVAEPVAEEPAPQEFEAQNPEPVTPEPIWKAEPVFTQASTEPKTAIDTEEPIFESYHTIDYFASQGIKLGQEDYKDRLGKQLKSFTEWLRSMKRIVPTEASASLDEVTNQSIQRIAEHSVEEKEVITEAMAEVWAKQGHPEKAIAVYEKLSLLNPAKSTYFAGRIEQLKAL